MPLDDIAREYAELLIDDPIVVGHELGFTKLTALHNDWVRGFVCGTDDEALQSHRGSYKTTADALAISIIAVLMPNKSVLFMRKTDDDVKEIIEQVRKILLHQAMQHIVGKIYGKPLKLLKTNANELTTSLVTRASGSVQLQGLGVNSSLTGKHADVIFTDDIVNLKDRISRAEREHTKQVYMELQNIKNRGGRIINTGTPWHKEDAFSLMPPARTFDCYTTGLITPEELADIRSKTAPSLFAANYELQHIASEGALFTTAPRFTSDASKLHDGIAHIDAAYGGDDACAMTLGKRGKDANGNDVLYMLGKYRPGHIDNCLDTLLLIKNEYRCGTIYVEENADKGYLKKQIREKGDRASGYHESTNKYIKISSYLKKWWSDIIWVEGTDKEYINQTVDYTEDSEHDDAPDSAASLARKLSSGAGGVITL